MKIQKTRAAELNEEIESTEFLSRLSFVVEKGMDTDELRDELETLINQEEVIYHGAAMEFLTENDASLFESLQIAADFGYEVQNLSSEILATLLLQARMTEDLNSIEL